MTSLHRDMAQDIWKVILDCDMVGKKEMRSKPKQAEGRALETQKEGEAAGEEEAVRETSSRQVEGGK